MEMRRNIVLDAALMSDRISTLIMLDPDIIDDGNPEFLKYLFFPLTRISAKMFRDSDFRMASFKNSYYKPEQITQADVDAYMEASRTENFVNAMVSMLKNYADPDELSSVGQVRQPVQLWCSLGFTKKKSHVKLSHELLKTKEGKNVRVKNRNCS
ncbi:MAG: hypothetical protein JXR86_21295 [Spirochaetales bacterium]|nr:hypothetical protein [Spirochaetales bacterium]